MSTFKANKKARASNDWDACMAVDKAAQVAAIRQRLSDVAAGACGCNSSFRMGVERAFDLVKVYPHHLGDTWTLNNLDSLAVWLWERGCRA